MKNASILVKLLTGFGCIILLLITLNAFSIVNLRKIEAQVPEMARELGMESEPEASAFIEKSERRADLTVLVQDIIFAVTVVCSVLIAWKLARDLRRPLLKLKAGMEEVAAGRLDVKVENDSRDEIGVVTQQLNATVDRVRDYIYEIRHILGEISAGNIDLSVQREYVGDFGEIGNSLNQIIDSLNGTMENIRDCAHQVSSGAEGLANGAQSLSQGAEEQTVAVDDFQNSLKTVAELTEQDGENAAKVTELSALASKAVAESDRRMEEMKSAMSEIVKSSKEIAGVIKLIDDIAFQTNMLALNAAVEAARAGAAGKGFAVVADEVRSLAARSSDAVSSTTEMIGKSVQNVENGMQIVEATAEALQNVDVNVRSMNDILAHIGESTIEQGRAFTRMTAAADQIANVVHANSSAAEENSASSEELSSQAEVLQRLMDRFKMRR